MYDMITEMTTDMITDMTTDMITEFQSIFDDVTPVMHTRT